MILPTEAIPLLHALAPSFTQPTSRRFVTLLLAAVLTTGRRTVANLLRTLGGLAPGHRTDYQRVLSRAPWSTLELGCALAGFLPRHLVPDGTVVLVGDDTVDGHPGKEVYGKARHRDPVRSTHSHTAWRYGHKWVVLAVLVRFPFAVRPWALPILVDLYRSREDNRRCGRPHRTPAQLMCRLLRLLLIRFPDRSFVFVGDAGYGTHELARSCHRRRDRLTLVSKLHPEANLFEPPPAYKGKGRPPVKGPRRPKPCEAVSAARRPKRLTVPWYGGGTRRVGLVTGTGHWFKSGNGLVPIRWVFVRDRSGTHRDEYFVTTDPTSAVAAIIAHYASRWNIETTFQELRCHLGSEHGPAGGAVLVRAVLGGRGLVPHVARGEAVRGDRLARQGDRDLLRCRDGGKALALVRVGFSTGRGRRGLGETSRASSHRAPGGTRTGRIAALQSAAVELSRWSSFRGPL